VILNPELPHPKTVSLDIPLALTSFFLPTLPLADLRNIPRHR
jgi:hypothetical protein